jgi:hypothetical protein
MSLPTIQRTRIRRIVSSGIAYLGGDPGCIASGADIRQVGGAPAPELAEAVAVSAALPDEYFLAAARARTRRDDRAGKQTETDFSCHRIRLYAKGRS